MREDVAARDRRHGRLPAALQPARAGLADVDGTARSGEDDGSRRAGAAQTGARQARVDGVAIGDQAVSGADPRLGLLGDLVDGVPVAARLLLARGAGQQVREVGRQRAARLHPRETYQDVPSSVHSSRRRIDNLHRRRYKRKLTQAIESKRKSQMPSTAASLTPRSPVSQPWQTGPLTPAALQLWSGERHLARDAARPGTRARTGGLLPESGGDRHVVSVPPGGRGALLGDRAGHRAGGEGTSRTTAARCRSS